LASAWFNERVSGGSKTLPFLIYFKGEAGWHEGQSHTQFTTAGTPVVIDIHTARFRLLVRYWPDRSVVKLFGRVVNIDEANVILVSGFGDSKRSIVVIPLGRFDLTVPTEAIPSVYLIEHSEDIRIAVTGPAEAQ